MSDWAAQVPTVTALAAAVGVGGLIQQVRALRLSVNRVEKLLEDKVEARLAALEKWAAGHEQQAAERWQRVKDHGGAE